MASIFVCSPLSSLPLFPNFLPAIGDGEHLPVFAPLLSSLTSYLRLEMASIFVCSPLSSLPLFPNFLPAIGDGEHLRVFAPLLPFLSSLTSYLRLEMASIFLCSPLSSLFLPSSGHQLDLLRCCFFNSSASSSGSRLSGSRQSSVLSTVTSLIQIRTPTTPIGGGESGWPWVLGDDPTR